MGLIGQQIRLGDVDNLEAFVQRTIDRSQIQYSPQEREELLAEGLAISYELAAKYKPLPMRPGIDTKPGRFSGYLAMFLPRRLGDAWHRNHPNHRYITDPDTGLRSWHYEAPMLSLDSLMDQEQGDGMLGPRYGAEHQLMGARSITAFCHATNLSPRTASPI
jgi:hypothetical protein